MDGSNPLVDGMGPIREGEPARNNFSRKNFSGHLPFRYFQPVTLKDKVTENEIALCLDPARSRFQINLILFDKIFGKQLAKPLLTNTRNLRKKNDQLVVPALNFSDFAGDDERAFVHDALASQNSLPVVN